MSTTAEHDTSPPNSHARSAQSMHRLRTTLRINATTSALGGAVAAIAPHRLDDILETGRPGWVRLVGLGLVVFAAFVVVASRSKTDALLQSTPGIVAGDASWVVGSIATIALGWYAAAGAATIAMVAAMVGTFAVLQQRFARAAVRS